MYTVENIDGWVYLSDKWSLLIDDHYCKMRVFILASKYVL